MSDRPGFHFIAVAALLAAACSAAQAQDQTLTGEDIRKAWVGKKVFARSPTGGLTDFFLYADGTAQVATSTVSDTGKWRPTDTGYCATWQKIRAGQERCFSVVRRGSTVYVINPDNSISAEILRVID